MSPGRATGRGDGSAQGSAPRAPIPMVDLVAQHAAIESELLDAFAEVIASGRFVLGETVVGFEAALAKLCEARFAISCNSGTDALWLALRALDVGPGDAVVCPAYSFYASAATIVRLGARPVFVDIDPATLNVDAEAARRALEAEPDVRAVLTVDLFGRMAELGALEAACAERGIPIVEDAAQAIGALDGGGRRPGERARVACFSFYPTKNLGALGDGGGLITSDPELAARLVRLRSHGESAPGVFEELGLNSRLDALQAAALSIKLRHLDRWTRARRDLARRYDALFAERGAAPANEPPGAAGLPLATPPSAPDPARHTYHRYVVRVPAERRAGLIDALAADGIASEIYYARGLHQQPSLARFAPERPLPETERAARETLALPLFPELPPEHVARVVDRVCHHLGGSAPARDGAD